MSKKPRRYAYTAMEYVDDLGTGTARSNSTLVPITIAAAALGVQPTTVRAHIRQGRLDEVAVDCGDVTVKGVTMGSLNAALMLRKDEVTALTERLADIIWHRGARTIEYGELMPYVGLSTSNPHHRDLIGRALGQMSEESQNQHGFMISALVVLKATGRPNESFFYFAEQNGWKKRSMSNERFWVEDIQRIRDWFGPQDDD